MVGDDGIERADDGEMKYVLLHVGDTMDPDKVKVPKLLDYWLETYSNTSKGGLTLDKVNNLVIWSSFSYRPILVSRAQGVLSNCHCLPNGYHPVPPNEDDAAFFTHGGWIFSTKGGRMGNISMVQGRRLPKRILLHGLMCKRSYLLCHMLALNVQSISKLE